MRIVLRWIRFVCLALLGVQIDDRCTVAFNLDQHSFITVRAADIDSTSSDRSQYFGFSHAFYTENNRTWLLIGAPRANSTNQPNESEVGVVYKCQLEDGVLMKDLCSELPMENEANSTDYIAYKFDQWFGVAIETAATNNHDQIVACGHRRKYTFTGDTTTCKDENFAIRQDCYRLPGICFSRDDLHTGSARRVSRNPPKGDITGNSMYTYAFPQWGASVRVSRRGHIIMGAPGTYQWQGGLIVNNNGTFSQVQDIAPGDSYLGYSVTEVRLPNQRDDELVVASGAPRFNQTGGVYIFRFGSCGGNSLCIRSNETISCEEFGSYFGASVLGEDVNGDGVDELFVGAPLQKLLQGEEGMVYYFAYSGSFRLVKRLTETGTTQAWGRFGTALASIGDVNLDGFNDIVVGSPFEDNHQGAIYLFLGSRNGIVTPFHQRIAASEVASGLKTFGHSISTGRDIDGNNYPDISVGAYLSDSVVVVRARPVHDVNATIWFPESEIIWHQPNCSKDSDDQTFRTHLTVSFFYSIPSKEVNKIQDVFIMTNFLNRTATLSSHRAVVFEDSPKQPLQLLVVPCLEGSSNQNCVSFRAADRSQFYLRNINQTIYLEDRCKAIDVSSYNSQTSFRINGTIVDQSVITIEALNHQYFYLNRSEGSTLGIRKRTGGENHVSEETAFKFLRRKYLPCIQNMTYDLSIENKQGGLLVMKDGQWATSVNEMISFSAENLYQPLNRSWTIVFGRYPKDITSPLKFRLHIKGPTFKKEPTSNVCIQKDLPLPVLNHFNRKDFSNQISFHKECGADNICSANLSVTMTPAEGDRGLIIIGSKSDFSLRIVIDNSGELAHSVRLEIIRPYILGYSTKALEDECNEVIVTPDVSSPSAVNSSILLQALYCDVLNQIHSDQSLAFRVSFDTKLIQSERSYPHDTVEFKARIGTGGTINADTKHQSFQIPLKYKSTLDLSGRATESNLQFSTRSPSDDQTLVHLFDILSNGPGLMPSVTVDILLPDDELFQVSKILSIKVTHKSQVVNDSIINGTEIITTSYHQTTLSVDESANKSSVTTSSSSQNVEENFILKAVATLVQAKSPTHTKSLNCETSLCSIIRRYRIEPMFFGDSIEVRIEVSMSAENLSKIENLASLNYTSIIMVSPYKISADVRQWRNGSVERSEFTIQASTILRPKREPQPIPIWIVIVGVVIGLFHIIAVILILKKCGFFDRKKYRHLQQIRDSRMDHMDDALVPEHAEADELEAGSNYDNDNPDRQSQKSQSQYSIPGGPIHESGTGDESKKTPSLAVDALRAKHPGVDFTAE